MYASVTEGFEAPQKEESPQAWGAEAFSQNINYAVSDGGISNQQYVISLNHFCVGAKSVQASSSDLCVTARRQIQNNRYQ